MKNEILLTCKILIFSLVFVSCNNELTLEQKMINHEERIHKRWNYIVDSKFEGNFTESGYREILVFFNIVHKKENVKSKETRLFVIDNNDTIVNVYNVYYRNFKVDDRNFIKEINKFKITYNNAIITDFNKNGKLELIYFAGEGSVFVFYIEEFKNGEFQHICQTYDGKLNQPGLDNFDLTHFDFETKSLYLSHRPKGEKIKLTWNPETEFYEKEILQK